jgi:MFS family permease
MPIRALLLLLSLISVLGTPYTVLMPLIASRVLHGSAGTLGALSAASGLGAVTGALYLASRSTVIGLGRIILVSAFLFGIALIGLGQAQTLWLSLPLSALAGLTMMVQMAASNTVIQTLADEDKRGRVMSFFSMAVFGMTPFGSLMAGALADRLGAGRTLLVCGVGCALGAILFMRALPELRRQARPIYQRLGIVPELASGIQTATQASAQAAS